MNVLHINYYDLWTGSGLASYRLHQELLQQSVNSSMLVIQKDTDDKSVFTPSAGACFYAKMMQRVSARLLRLQKSRNPNPHSMNFFPGFVLSRIREINPDIVHLHWINGEMLSIHQIALLNKPIVWTFHDAWPFCGTEHHFLQDGNLRWKEGYTRENNQNRGFDFDRFLWEQKQKYWSSLNLIAIAPSLWMKRCIASSRLFSSFPVFHIPNGIHVSGQAYIKAETRKKLGFPIHKKIIGFGAANLSTLKGRNDLISLIQILGKRHPEYLFVGVGADSDFPKMGNVVFLGKLSDCALFYSALNCFISCSKFDNLPNMLIEAMLQDIPCVAFDVGGVSEIIRHKENGYLVQAFSLPDFIDGIEWGLAGNLTLSPHRFVCDKFNIVEVATEYKKIYQTMLKCF